MSTPEPVVREADRDDVVAICRFGEAHIRVHYAPLIGAAAADEQVRSWWSETQIAAAVAAGQVVVAEEDGQVVGVGQRGRRGADHVVYKLYVHPRCRGRGLGPRLIDALARQLPADADRLYLEHFAANERAGAFYEREGFTVQRVEPSPTGNPALAVVWRARAHRPGLDAAAVAAALGEHAQRLMLPRWPVYALAEPGDEGFLAGATEDERGVAAVRVDYRAPDSDQRLVVQTQPDDGRGLDLVDLVGRLVAPADEGAPVRLSVLPATGGRSWAAAEARVDGQPVPAWWSSRQRGRRRSIDCRSYGSRT